MLKNSGLERSVSFFRPRTKLGDLSKIKPQGKQNETKATSTSTETKEDSTNEILKKIAELRELSVDKIFTALRCPQEKQKILYLLALSRIISKENLDDIQIRFLSLIQDLRAKTIDEELGGGNNIASWDNMFVKLVVAFNILISKNSKSERLLWNEYFADWKKCKGIDLKQNAYIFISYAGETNDVRAILKEIDKNPEFAKTENLFLYLFKKLSNNDYDFVASFDPTGPLLTRLLFLIFKVSVQNIEMQPMENPSTAPTQKL